MPSSQKGIAAELLKRRQARKTFQGFAQYIDIPGVALSDDEGCEDFESVELGEVASHHSLLFSTIDDLVDGKIKRAMFLLPPGSAKSTYGNVCLAPYAMGRKSNTNIISTSYGTSLANKMGRRSRSIAKQDKFHAVFDCGLVADNKAAHEWSLTNGSTYMAGGIRSGITGNRADGLIVDDPLKGREEAESELIRTKTKEAYDDDLKTRLKPNGWVLMILTRWHQADLAGEILPENWDGESGDIECRDGNIWRVVCIPAECVRADDPLGRKIGEFIWPEWFPKEHWIEFKLNPRTWSSLYQQRPSPEEGSYFKKDWFGWFDLGPGGEVLNAEDKNGNRINVQATNKYGASDYAITKKGGDWTVHLVADVDQAENIFLTDLWRDQAVSDEWVEAFITLANHHKPLLWGEESGQIIKSLDPFIVKRMQERNCYVYREQYPSLADKPARARAIQARASMGKVFLPRNAPWVSAFLSELLMFDNGAHDDQVDALSLIGRMLDNMVGGQPASKEKKQKDRWDRAFESDDYEENWKLA